MPAADTSRELKTRRAIAGCLLGRGPSRLLLAGLTLAITIRVVSGLSDGWLGDGGGVGVADAVVVAIGAAVIGPVEWVVHRYLFHAPAASTRTRVLGTGRRHLLHHEDPTDVALLLLDRRGMIVLMAGTAALTTVWAAPVGLAAGRAVVALGVTGIVVAWAALANYEWTHLLSHSGYRIRSRRYRRLARRHLHHHHRDDGQWFGVTSNLGDRLFATAAPE